MQTRCAEPAGKKYWWSYVYAVCALVGVFLLASGGLYGLAQSLSYRNASSEDGSSGLYFPSSLEELKDVAGKLQSFKEQNWYSLLAFFSAAYLYKQSFAIPGSFFLNILAGALFGLWAGLALVSILSATGASCCYLLSWAFGKDLVVAKFSHHIRPLQEKLTGDNGSLLFLLISVRVLPMTPNWLLNLLSPILGVPLHLFFLSVLVGMFRVDGLLPYNFLCIQTGLVLSQLQTLAVLEARSVLSLVIATAALLATALVLRRCRSKVKTT